MDYWAYLILIVAFLGLFGFIESAIILWSGWGKSEARRLKQRLQIISGENPTQKGPNRLKRGVYSSNESIDRFLKRFRRLEALDTLLRQADKPYSVAQTLTAMVSSSFVALIATLIAGSGLLSVLLLTVIAGILPLVILQTLRRSRMNKLESQLPDALDLLGQSMRAGHAFSSALRTVGIEGPEPIATEFRMTSDEISFGSSTREGILNLANRVNSMDMRYFALAILIQSETGGNLSNLLLDLAKLIRERLKLRRVVKVLAAEGRLSGWILGSLPFAFAGLMSLMNPGYLSFFWVDPSGWPIVKVMAVLMIVGAIWIRNITNIRV
ncbi:MAG: type II secretion system F family protein [Betaproteobacteria bacterium]|nr:type II secretion system F family protein [Betaproteobacteria bacterium]